MHNFNDQRKTDEETREEKRNKTTIRNTRYKGVLIAGKSAPNANIRFFIIDTWFKKGRRISRGPKGVRFLQFRDLDGRRKK